MDAQVFAEHFDLEDTHWWFRSKRIADPLAPAALRRPRQGPGLDVGCGAGRHAGGPRPAGHLGRCRCRSRPRSSSPVGAGSPRLAGGGAEALPFRQGTFAACLCLDLLYHRNVGVGERRAPGVPPGPAPRRPAPRDRLGLQVAPLGTRRGGARRPPLHPRRELVERRRGPRASRRCSPPTPTASSSRSWRPSASPGAAPRAARTCSRCPARSIPRSSECRRSSGRSCAWAPLPFGSSVVLVARKAAA